MTGGPDHGVTGAILAGGEGRRMGGLDKGLVAFGDTTLVEAVLTRFRPQVDDLLISANRHHERYAALADRVVADSGTGERRGPLAGMLAAMEASTTPWLAVVPCDAPCLPSDLVARLSRAVEGTGAPAACARAGGRVQPVFALLSRRLHDDLARAVAGDERAVRRWLDGVGAVAVDFDNPDAFANANSPADVARLVSRHRDLCGGGKS